MFTGDERPTSTPDATNGGDEQLKSGSKKGGKRHFELFLDIFTSPTLPIKTQGALPKYPLFTTLSKTRSIELNRV